MAGLLVLRSHNTSEQNSQLRVVSHTIMNDSPLLTYPSQRS